MITKQTSQAFQIAGLIATILVVAIHSNTKRHIDISNSITVNYYIQEFISNGIARLAVPFFAFSAGIFFFLKYKNLIDYKINLFKRLNTIVVPYILTCTLIFFTEYLYIHFLKEEPYPLSAFVLLNDIFLAPLAIQFWFLRDLIVLFILSPLIFYLTNSFRLLYLLLIFLLWLFDIQIMPLVSDRHLIVIETIFFYSLGCYFAKNIFLLEHIINKTTRFYFFLALSTYLLLIIIRVIIDPFFSNGTDNYSIFSLITQNLQIIIGVFILLLFSDYISKSKRKNKDWLIFLSSYSFFVYMYHGLSINRVINKFSDYILLDAYKFYLTLPLILLLTFSLAIIIDKYYPRSFSIITGGRNRLKTLSRNSP
jgi:surface polysaccharide O-acyltransferase-like enzyme